MGILEYRTEKTLRDGLPSYKARSVPDGSRKSATGRYRIGSSTISTWGGVGSDGYMQETTSFNHAPLKVFRDILKVDDWGGPFFTRKFTLTSDVSTNTLYSSSADESQNIYTSYKGMVYPSIDLAKIGRNLSQGSFLLHDSIFPDYSMSRKALKEQGVKMMLSANPTQPAYRAADALAELFADQSLMGIPLLDFLKRGWPGIAGEYLNLQFAILPTISDGKTIWSLSQKTEAIMQQYLRDADNNISRKRRIPTIVTATSTTYTNSQLADPLGHGFPGQLQGGNGRLVVTTVNSRDIWFEGVYHELMKKSASKFERTLKQWNAVYGFAPTLKSVWEATPFSWMVDYFTNAQEFIQGTFVAGGDGSLLVRGYVMCTTRVKTTYTWSGNLMVRGSLRPFTFTWITDEVIKQRECARPYGLAWTSQPLTGKQMSILAALGISMVF